MNITKLLLTFALVMSTSLASAQYTAVKINTLTLATATLDVGVDVAVSQKWSVGASVMWIPLLDHTTAITFNAKRWRFEPNIGWFIGMHSTTARYRVDEKRGWTTGLGSSIGYSWILSKRWNFSLEGGLGVYYANDKWLVPDTSPLDDILIRHRKRIMLLPSKFEVSFSYMF